MQLPPSGLQRPTETHAPLCCKWPLIPFRAAPGSAASSHCVMQPPGTATAKVNVITSCACCACTPKTKKTVDKLPGKPMAAGRTERSVFSSSKIHMAAACCHLSASLAADDRRLVDDVREGVSWSLTPERAAMADGYGALNLVGDGGVGLAGGSRAQGDGGVRVLPVIGVGRLGPGLGQGDGELAGHGPLGLHETLGAGRLRAQRLKALAALDARHDGARGQ